MIDSRVVHVTPPRNAYLWDGDAQVFDYDREGFAGMGIERVWCWYRSGEYEGNGSAVIRRDGRYNVVDLSHCSCDGPWDHIPDISSDVATLEELELKLSGAFADELAPCIIAARLEIVSAIVAKHGGLQ